MTSTELLGPSGKTSQGKAWKGFAAELALRNTAPAGSPEYIATMAADIATRIGETSKKLVCNPRDIRRLGDKRNEVVEVEEGVIVTKLAMESSPIAASYDCIEPGAVIPKHYHQSKAEFQGIVLGDLEVYLAGVAYPLSGGTLIGIPEGMVHGAKDKSDKRVYMVSLYIPKGKSDDYHEVVDLEKEEAQDVTTS